MKQYKQWKKKKNWFTAVCLSAVCSMVLMQSGEAYAFSQGKEAPIAVASAVEKELPLQTLPLIWSKQREFVARQEGSIVLPFWQEADKTTAIFSVNKSNPRGQKGNFYTVAASNKMDKITAEYRAGKLLLNFYEARISLKKSQLQYPKDRAISEVRVVERRDTFPQTVQLEFALRPTVKDFAFRLDELGERLWLEMITNAITQISLAGDVEGETLTVEGFETLHPTLHRLGDGVIELVVPSAINLVGERDARVDSRLIHRMAVVAGETGKTHIRLWLKEGVEYAPDGEKLRLFPAKSKDFRYNYGVLTIRKPANFDLSKMDYLLDIHQRKASVSFPYQGYFKGEHWIGDSAITKIVEKEGRWEFFFPTVHELTVAEDRDNVYISARKPKEVFSKVVFIDIGHGGNDTGAIRRADIGFGERDYFEKDANFSVAMLLKEKLDKHKEFKIYYSRLDDSNPSPAERAALANESGADFFLSLHNNATTVKDRKIEGTDVYYYAGRNTGELSAKRLSEIILRHYAKTTSFSNRLLSHAPHLYMVKYPKMPAAIVETGFMTDSDDLRKIFSQAEQEKTAQALYDSIIEALGYLN